MERQRKKRLQLRRMLWRISGVVMHRLVLLKHEKRHGWLLSAMMTNHMSPDEATARAEAILDWLGAQTYGTPAQSLLHVAIACDFVSRQHVVLALSRLVVQPWCAGCQQLVLRRAPVVNGSCACEVCEVCARRVQEQRRCVVCGTPLHGAGAQGRIYGDDGSLRASGR